MYVIVLYMNLPTNFCRPWKYNINFNRYNKQQILSDIPLDVHSTKLIWSVPSTVSKTAAVYTLIGIVMLFTADAMLFYATTSRDSSMSIFVRLFCTYQNVHSNTLSKLHLRSSPSMPSGMSVISRYWFLVSLIWVRGHPPHPHLLLPHSMTILILDSSIDRYIAQSVYEPRFIHVKWIVCLKNFRFSIFFFWKMFRIRVIESF